MTTNETAGDRAIPYIPALDGIRGLAVAAVVAFHLDRFAGGYLGVDAFFVLSGYLITRILLTELEKRGDLRLGRFYARRARRLLPAVLVVLAVVAVWGELWAYADDLESLRSDSIAALFYVANWNDIASANAYWDAEAAPSPLSHMWSLAIEEQFYIVWPIALLLLWRVGRRNFGQLAGWIAILAASSAVAMAVLHSAGDDPNRVYLGTDTRAQSLLTGAALAAALMPASPLLQIVERFRRPLAWAAWALVPALALAWWQVDGQQDWLYEGGFALHGIAVAVIIAALVTGSSGLSAVLSWSPLVWLGRISYGVYLWHWPLIVWLTPERMNLEGWRLDVALVALSLLVSIISYQVVEMPIRTAGALTDLRTAYVAPAALAACAGLLVITTGPDRVDLDDFAVPDLVTTTTTSGSPPPDGSSTTTADTTQPGRTTVAASTTTTVAPKPHAPVVLEPGETLRVAYVGDSIAQQVEPTLAFVLQEYGELDRLVYAGTALCDWLDDVEELAPWQPHVIVIDHGGNALTPCMLDQFGESLASNRPAYDAKYIADTDLAIELAHDMGARVLLIDQPLSRRGSRSGTGEIFAAAAEANLDGTVRFFSTHPILSPGEFLQSAECTDDEPGCVDGEGQLRSRPPGNHLEPLGIWRYALGIRQALNEAGWLGVNGTS